MIVDQVIVERCLLTYTKIEEYQCKWICKVLRDNKYEPGACSFLVPLFVIGEYSWNTCLYFGGYDIESKDYVSILLRRFTKSIFVNSNFKATIKLSIIDKNNKEQMQHNFTMSGNNVQHCFKKFVKRDDLLSSSDLLPNDELKLLCRVLYHNNKKETLHSEIICTPWSILRCRNLQMSNFEKMFDNPEYSDFQIIVGNTRIKVHKCILAAHSPVFAAMFQSDMLEKNKSEVEIKDVDVNVMRQLLRFIYVGETENIYDFVDKLFIAADKYQVIQLKELCQEKLVKKLNLHNLYEILKLVDKFDTGKLKNAAIEFIVTHSKELLAMKEFKKFMETLSSILLAQIVCSFMANSI